MISIRIGFFGHAALFLTAIFLFSFTGKPGFADDSKSTGAGTSLLQELVSEPDFDPFQTAYLFADPDTGIDRMLVIGSRVRQLEIPGANTYIGPEELEEFEYDDIHRILRRVPGVYIQEEDGFGLRPNIGIRGSGADRSSRITLMEDGVLIAPAPYAAPAAYYFPNAARLYAVEVRKGSSTIKFGPRTTGGALNLVSTPVPAEPEGSIKLRGGKFGLFEGLARVGGTFGQFGILVEAFHAQSNGFKQLPNGANTGFNIDDFVVKLRWASDGDAKYEQFFELKLGYTKQVSNETYLGITDNDFSDNPFQRYAASALDQFNSEHYQVQATHFIRFHNNVDLTTLIYYNDFNRDWFKVDDLDFDDGRGRIRPSVIFADPGDPLNVAALAVLRGDADSVDDAIQLRHNARSYYSYGFQNVLGIAFNTGNTSHEVEVGLRYHKDQEDRLQNREKFKMEGGQLVLTTIDPPGSQSNRLAQAEALAFFVQDEIEIGRFRLVPGLRFEHVELARFDFSKTDPDRLLGPTSTRMNTVNEVIPGFGVSYRASDALSLLFGVHKGFAPPGPSSQNAQSEESINFEAGFRWIKGELFIEAIGYFNRFNNLMGTCTSSAGCKGGDIGDQFNAGRVNVGGIEFTADYELVLGNGINVPLGFNYTFTHAEFLTAFEDGFFGMVMVGDQLPYLPRHQFTATIGLEMKGVVFNILANYVSSARNTAGSGPIPMRELIDERIVFDTSLHYQVMENVNLFILVENLFDDVYIVARRPYGPRPGKPRTISGGLKFTF